MSTSWNSEDSFWKRTVVYSAAAVAVVAAGGAYYYFKVMKGGDAPKEGPPVVQAPVTPPADVEKEHHPLPGAEASDKPLPKLNESDPDITQALASVFGKKPIDQMLVPESVVRHIVVTVDNLPRNKVAEQMRPVKPVGGPTVTNSSGDSITLSEENSARYAAFMKVVQGTDSKQLGALYIRYYPLFQQAYEDLGYPGAYFNDRLVEVIDHLLQTPDVRGPVELKQGRVFYEYADPALEARSAGQKLLLRMGPANAAAIKKKLTELRVVVTTSQDPPDEPGASGAAGGGVDPNAGTGASAPSSSDAPTVKPDTSPEAAPTTAPR